MKIDFAVVCDYALIDQYGKLSVMGIFQHIWVSQFPTVHPRLHLVIRLRGRRTEVGSHDLTIRLRDDEQSEVLSGSGTVTFNEPPAGITEIEAGTILAFDTPFARAGRYEFVVRIDDELETVVPITVSQSTRPPQATPPAPA